MKIPPATLQCDPPHVVFQECPGEVALCFSFYGCPLRCAGCHSEELWQANGGHPLTLQTFNAYLDRYAGLITAVVFFGGEWQPLYLKKLLQVAQQRNLITCLYSGLNHVSRHLRPVLNFVKLGPWRQQQGGLSNPNSNQHFYALENGQLSQRLNHLFHNTQTQPNTHTHNKKGLSNAAA